MKQRLLFPALALVLLLTWIAAPVSAESFRSMLEELTAYKLAEAGAADLQTWIDGAMTASAGTSAEWDAITLSRLAPETDRSAYADALEAFVRETPPSSAAARQRCALALSACGRDESEFVRSAPDTTIGKQGIISWIFGLHLLNNGVPSESFSAGDIAAELLRRQLPDGGWALSGDHADVDVTAMTLQALAPLAGANEAIRAAVEAGLNCLSARQLPDGGYQGFGAPNAESCAQVLLALTSAGIDPLTDERFIKNGNTLADALAQYRLPEGCYSHEADGACDPSAVTQVFYALASAELAASGRGRLFVFDESTLPLDAVRELPAPAETPIPAAPQLPAEAPVPGRPQWQRTACLIIAGLVLLGSLTLFLRGKRNLKNYLFLLICGALLCAAALLLDIQKPEDYYRPVPEKPDAVGKVTLTIRCDTVSGQTSRQEIPADGVILPVTEFPIRAGETVYDILVEAARTFSIQMESEDAAGSYGMVYISGIHSLYEFDFGELSGWVYHVNGQEPSVGCGSYSLSDGDRIEWLYTLDLGNDVREA